MSNIKKSVIEAINSSSDKYVKSIIAFDWAFSAMRSDEETYKIFNEPLFKKIVEEMVEAGADVDVENAVAYYNKFIVSEYNTLKAQSLGNSVC